MKRLTLTNVSKKSLIHKPLTIIMLALLSVSWSSTRSADNGTPEQTFFFDFNSLPTGNPESTDGNLEPENSLEPSAQKIEQTFSTQELTQAADQIKSLTQNIASFITKATAIPDIDNRVKKLHDTKEITLGRIKDWQELKTEIDLLQALLHKLQTIDAVTKNFRYLKYLLADPALLEKLKTFNQKILSLNANFSIDSYFGLIKMSNSSKKALRNLLSAFGVAITQDQLVVTIANALKQFDPEAKKILAQEQKAIARALTQKGRGSKVTLQSVGSESGPSFPFGGGSLDMFGFGPSPFGSTDNPFSFSSTQPTTSTPSTSPQPNKPGSTAPSDHSKYGSKEKDKEKKEEEQKKKEERAQDQEAIKSAEKTKSPSITKGISIPETTAKTKPADESPNTLIQQIEDTLHEARNLMFPSDKVPEETQVLSPLITSANFAAGKPISYEVITLNIPKFYHACQTINELIQKLTAQLAENPNLKTNAQQKLKAEWEFRNKDHVSGQTAGFTQLLEQYAQIFKEIAANQNILGNEQQEAYFWNREPDNNVTPPTAATSTAIPDPAEMKKIFDTQLETLEKSITAFSEPQQEAYNLVKSQITENNIRTWLEQRTILVDGKASPEFEALQKDTTNPFFPLLQQARKQASIQIIKSIRYASLYNIGFGLEETKKNIEGFIYGKQTPLPKSEPTAEQKQLS